MRIKSVLLYIMFVCALGACKKDNIEERLLEEERILGEYITNTFGASADSLGGGAFLVKTKYNVDGAKVEAGNYILWNWKVTNQITEELEYTSDLSSHKFPDSYVDGGPEITVVLSTFPIDEGLKKMNKGEKGDVYIPSRWLLCDFQPRIFSVEIDDVIKDLSVYQEDMMSRYIRRTYDRAKVDTISVVSTIDKTEYNVMYHIIEQGDGDKITRGMNVETKTSTSCMIRERDNHSYLVDEDRRWSTNAGEKINTLTKTNCVGEILEKMNKGGKVVVTMSSKLYWEDKNLPKNKQTDQYIVPKWSVVIFTINIK